MNINIVVDYPSEPILAGETKVFKTEICGLADTIIVSCKTDQSGSLYVEFSVDGVNFDSTLTYNVNADVNEIHRIVVGRNYYRIRFTNTSSSNQSYFRLQAIKGSSSPLTNTLNSQVQQDADAIITRPLDFNLMVSSGLFQNHQSTIKDGVNFDIDTARLPEDLWSEGGVYAGFPTGTPEEGQIVVAGADTGTVWYSYLASSTSTDYVFTSKSVTGAGNYNLGHNIYRCNFMYFTGSATNVGKITIRNVTTTTNIFCTIDAGVGQSYCAAYTVPYGSTIYLDRISGSLRGSTSGSIDGYIWYRPNGESPRLRFPFNIQFGSLYFDDINYLTSIPQQVDIIPRVTVSSANNLAVQISYRFSKVKS